MHNLTAMDYVVNVYVIAMTMLSVITIVVAEDGQGRRFTRVLLLAWGVVSAAHLLGAF